MRVPADEPSKKPSCANLVTRRDFLFNAAASMSVVAGCGSSLKLLQTDEMHEGPFVLPRRSDLAERRRERGTIDVFAGAGDPIETQDPVRTITLRPGELIPGIYSGDDFGNTFSLSFDDVPRPNFARLVLPWLHQNGLHATFFVVGHLVKRYPGLVRQLVAEGHELGNHSYTHRNFARMTVQEIVDDLQRTQDAVDKALGRHLPIKQVRPPYGAPFYGRYRRETQVRVATAISRWKACCVNWSLDSYDTRSHCTPESLIKRVFRATRKDRGGVMVFHPTRCSKRSLYRVLRLVKRSSMKVLVTSEMVERKYGHSVIQLGEYGQRHLSQWIR